ncbi:hypothetical protein BD410DRAFT_810312 [Rickenella mellea]|uniref:Uncharacterized protein n=1 Tax=Rickenella mellea TaxID=50990 RepID=A0A4Y7PGR2_9AGAM|nr:hypothetical protein BD410DRAFT_810312 [Rickenella mellea]
MHCQKVVHATNGAVLDCDLIDRNPRAENPQNTTTALISGYENGKSRQTGFWWKNIRNVQKTVTACRSIQRVATTRTKDLYCNHPVQSAYNQMFTTREEQRNNVSGDLTPTSAIIEHQKNIGTLRSAIESAHKLEDKCEEADKDEPKPVAKRPPGGDWDPPETWHVDRLVVVHFESEPQVPNRLESLKAGLNECQSSTIAVHVWPDIPAPRRRITSRRSIAVGRWAERLATKAAEESLEVTWEFPNRVFRFLRRFLLEVYSSTELEAFAEPFHVRRSVEGSKDSSHATVAE